MRGVILDASIILMLINQEQGHEHIKELLSDAVMSSVNIAEAAGILIARHKLSLEEASTILGHLIAHIVPFDEQQAYLAAELEAINQEHKYNLSLGDRACIALGVAMGLPIYTADRMWKKVSFKNASVVLLK
jgi:PIN domain nuclease of toxin-antitoxin system